MARMTDFVPVLWIFCAGLPVVSLMFFPRTAFRAGLEAGQRCAGDFDDRFAVFIAHCVGGIHAPTPWMPPAALRTACSAVHLVECTRVGKRSVANASSTAICAVFRRANSGCLRQARGSARLDLWSWRVFVQVVPKRRSPASLNLRVGQLQVARYRVNAARFCLAADARVRLCRHRPPAACPIRTATARPPSVMEIFWSECS